MRKGDTSMDLHARLTALAKIERTATPVVSVYLDTRWTDEHQRDRVRVFLKNELAKARRVTSGPAAEADLDWIQAQGEELVAQTRPPDARGVALFACQALGLREFVPARVPFENSFVVADAPSLRPLAAMLEEAPSALVVFVDAEHARVIPLGPHGAGEEVTLQSEVPGRHGRGGWAQTAQSRYQRHIQEHRARHFEAVAESLAEAIGSGGVERIILAGEPKNAALLRKSLAPRIAQLVAGSVSAARHEAAAVIVARATELLEQLERGAERIDVDGVLVEAAKSKQAVAGLEETLEAVNRGAVHRLYLLKGFGAAGRLCAGCGGLQPGSDPRCRLCASETTAIELADAMADRVIAAGGEVETVEAHQVLAQVGGAAARLRYAL